MAAMATDTILTTAPASFPILRRPQWCPSPRISSTRLLSSRPRALRVSCCATSTPTVGRTEELRGGGDGDSSSCSGRGYGEVYVASMPLRAPKGAAQVFDAMKDFAIFANFQHYMTIIKPNDGGDQAHCTVLDFQPQNPEDPMTAVAVLMGKSIPGVILERTLSRLPNQRCWKVGPMKPGLSLKDAVAFSSAYNAELSLGVNDCRHHTLDLVEYLTGKSMSFIEEVRKDKGWVETLVAGLEEEREEELEKSLEESPDVESVEKPVKAVSSINERVQYVPGVEKYLLSVGVFIPNLHDILESSQAPLNFHENERIYHTLFCKVERAFNK